jgi:hypothetical protein
MYIKTFEEEFAAWLDGKPSVRKRQLPSRSFRMQALWLANSSPLAAGLGDRS